MAAADLDADYAADRRGSAVMALILLETAALSEVPLHVALPHEQPFARLCRDYLADPDLAVTNTDWARAAAMSERMFTRRFRGLTGTSPAAWRSRARLLASIPLLRHRTVTEVATVLGYASPAAFSYAFTRAFDVPPSSMRRR
ncbi:helix-turn-helix domain-containing protein [Streptomyces sp. NPDC001594]|uniref:helix-turn-helix domain-containing protein n=1 Tax=Streptomyces sp. NPDC001594 TaxID=3364590 RepID=UPI0036A28826